MSTRVIRLPDIGEGITEAEIVEWLVSVGDAVAEDQSIGSVMTDKAAVEIPSPVSGVVEALSGQVGEVLSVGSEYARIRMSDSETGETGETAADTESEGPTANGESTGQVASGNRRNASEHAQPSVATATSSVTESDSERDNDKRRPAATRPARARSEKPTASPAVRRRAYRRDISLADVQGSGPGGRILHEDLDRYLASKPGRTLRSSSGGADHDPDAKGVCGSFEETRVIGMRRAIAKKMQTAKQHIPHFSYIEEIDVTELQILREQLNERSGSRHARLTMLPFIVLATVRSLTGFPRMNARYDDEAEIIRQYHEAHVGIATQTDNGLMVPVLRQAHAMDVRTLAAAITHLADAARNSKLGATDMGEGTITVTSLGALGGLVSTPVINYPEVAIVGVNRIVTRPMFVADQVVPRQLMNLSCSFDHRVIDGHDAARFVQCIKGYLEFPPSLFVPV